MSSNSPRRVYVSAGRRRARRRAWLFLATATAALVLLALVLAGTWSGERREPRAAVAVDAPAAAPPRSDAGPLGSEDGYVAVGASISPFSEEPAIARLDSALRAALQQAATDAGAEGITLRVNGGWRSVRYQRVLLERAIETHGSVEIARQYVKPPEESSHVTGDGVDIGPADAAGWLAENGGEYGLCLIYANEPWHFELATDPGGTCPALIENAAGG